MLPQRSVNIGSRRGAGRSSSGPSSCPYSSNIVEGAFSEVGFAKDRPYGGGALTSRAAILPLKLLVGTQGRAPSFAGDAFFFRRRLTLRRAGAISMSKAKRRRALLASGILAVAGMLMASSSAWAVLVKAADW